MILKQQEDGLIVFQRCNTSASRETLCGRKHCDYFKKLAKVIGIKVTVISKNLSPRLLS